MDIKKVYTRFSKNGRFFARLKNETKINVKNSQEIVKIYNNLAV